MSAEPVTAISRPEFFAPQFDYKPRETTQPYYRYTKVPTLSGTQSLTISPSSQQETLMEIPVKVVNFSKCILDFSEYVDAQLGAYSWLKRDAIGSISQVQLMTRGGLILADLNNLQNHSNSVRKVFTSASEATSNDITSRLTVSNELDNDVASLFISGTVAGTVVTEVGLNYISEMISVVGGSNAATPASDNARRVMLPFDQIFRGTVLAVDKDLYFGEPLIFRIVWGPGTKVGFKNTASASDPTSGSAAQTGNTNISNLTLYLAVESNPENAKSVMNTFYQSGLSTLVPYTHSQKVNLTNAGTHNISLRFNRASHGRTLKAIFIVPYHATESGATAYDHSNSYLTASVQKITSYYTSLDSQRLQEYNLNCTAATGDDWRHHRSMLKDSMIAGRSHYMADWFHCDDFSYITTQIDSKIPNNLDKELIFSGQPLDVEKRYDFTAEATATLNYYCWAICQRLLVIRPNDIHFE